MKKLILIILILLIGVVLVLNKNKEKIVNEQDSTNIIDYAIWDAVLKQYVNDQGLVDYVGLKNNRAEFDRHWVIP